VLKRDLMRNEAVLRRLTFPAPAAPCRRSAGLRRGFTLLEVMIALAILAIALMPLLALDHQDIQGVIRAQDMSRAAMLAQGLMTQAEIGPFTALANATGNFDQLYPREYPNFRWRQTVTKSGTFPDVDKVSITIFYGPGFDRTFDLVEFLHNPIPPELQQ
jgi:general secretion pathway protein I